MAIIFMHQNNTIHEMTITFSINCPQFLFFEFGFDLGAADGSAQDLLLTVHLWVTPGKAAGGGGADHMGSQWSNLI